MVIGHFYAMPQVNLLKERFVVIKAPMQSPPWRATIKDHGPPPAQRGRPEKRNSTNCGHTCTCRRPAKLKSRSKPHISRKD